MRILPLILVPLLTSGCTREPPPPAPPAARAAERAAERPAELTGQEPVEEPRQPTAAFVPSESGCPQGYRTLEDICVHRLYQPASEPALAAALADYRRGAAPPMLGPVPSRRVLEEAPSTRPDPGALMQKSAATKDGGSAKEQRLAELDAMLALAREKLRQRDEQSRAKKVENAPRAKSSGDDGGGLERLARGLGGAGGRPQAGAGDPTAARLDELSQIASQLSGEQLEALRSEFGKSGLDADALEAILAEGREH